METRLAQEHAGREFDKWLDWNGNADESNAQALLNSSQMLGSGNRAPISPSSTVKSDQFTHNVLSSNHTAPLFHDLPTPTNSSGSPETAKCRLSGETLSEDASVYRQPTLKRKISQNDSFSNGYQPVPSRPTGSKRPHNVIEKRYRANLNEKIAELRDSVPALRAVKKAKGKTDVNASSDEEDLDGLAPSNKLNKASILTKAVEYIRHLEFRTKKLEEENKSLKERLRVLDKVIEDGGHDAARTAAFTSTTTVEQTNQSEASTPSSDVATTSNEPRGLIGIPDSFRRMRESQPQEHYGEVYASSGSRSRLSGKWPQRIMLGSLAGLMVMEGFSESDTGDVSREKALFGIPLEILDGWAFLRSPRIYLGTFVQYCQTGGIIPLIKGFMALSILAFLVFAYMFNSKPPSKDATGNAELDAPEGARPSSPIEVRRRAWSTSMQALHLPHHSFFPEWLAVTSEWVKYSLRYWIGANAYAWLTGLSSEDEKARIKAWDIAIDAQLAGGDVEVSRSRAVLTIFGSGTLPQTPLRLMMKAFHTRVVLHNVGLPDTITAKVANYIATFIADRQWRHARQIHEGLRSQDPDRLPGYLNYLLQMECDEVLTTIVTQRACNLMYDRPTAEYAEDPLMDVVVEDHAIRSPLDAIAAWRSTSALHEALNAAVESPDATDLLREHVQSALEIAPPGSAAETRALAVHAVLSPGRRHAFYLRAAEAIAPSGMVQTGAVSNHSIPQDESVPYFIDSSTPISARPEIAACLSSASVMLKLEQDQDADQAIELFCKLQWPDAGTEPSMLSTAPLYFVLTRLLRTARKSSSLAVHDECLLPQCTGIAYTLYRSLRAESDRLGNYSYCDIRSHLSPALDLLMANWDIRPSAAVSRRHSNVSNDTGYVSLDEEDIQSTKRKEAEQFEHINNQANSAAVFI